MSLATTTRIGTISDAAKRYGTDAAAIWAWICSEQPRTLTDGRRVMLVADPEKRDGTLWVVEEVEVVPMREIKRMIAAEHAEPRP